MSNNLFFGVSFVSHLNRHTFDEKLTTIETLEKLNAEEEEEENTALHRKERTQTFLCRLADYTLATRCLIFRSMMMVCASVCARVRLEYENDLLSIVDKAVCSFIIHAPSSVHHLSMVYEFV